jgi:hypothetical protein
MVKLAWKSICIVALAPNEHFIYINIRAFSLPRLIRRAHVWIRRRLANTLMNSVKTLNCLLSLDAKISLEINLHCYFSSERTFHLH